MTNPDEYEEDEELREMRDEYQEEIHEAREDLEENKREIEKEIQEKERKLEQIRDKINEKTEKLNSEYSEELEEEIDDLREDLEKTYEEYRELEDHLKEATEEGELEIYEKEREMHQKINEKVQKLREKVREKAVKAREKAEKARQKAEKYTRKAQSRINISVPEDLSDEWRNWGEQLGSSVSELVRRSMKFVKDNIGDPDKLDQWGRRMERWGDKLEKAVQVSGNTVERKVKQVISPDKELIKKRIRGMVILERSIPIDKLAQVLQRSDKFAENLIYELVAEGVQGELEARVFKYEGDPEEMLTVLFKLIDKM
jgi:chromosome segregation ATPase